MEVVRQSLETGAKKHSQMDQFNRFKKQLILMIEKIINLDLGHFIAVSMDFYTLYITAPNG